MDNLTLDALLPPMIALGLTVILYGYLAKKAVAKATFKRFMLLVSVTAFLLNLAWEMLQVPLYQGGTYNLEHFLFCVVVSVADVIMILLIYLGLALVYKSPLWVYNFKWQRIIAVILIGALGAALAEIKHTSEGTWSYADSMPVIPIINVGLSPVLQFTVLPVLVFYTGYYFLNKGKLPRATRTLKKKLYE